MIFFHIFCVIDQFTRLVWIIQIMIINKIFCVFGQQRDEKFLKGLKKLLSEWLNGIVWTNPLE